MKMFQWVSATVLAIVVAGAVPAAEPARTVDDVHPGVVRGALSGAAVGDLPEGVLLKAETFQVTEKEFQAEVEKAQEIVRESIRKNAPFFLEQMVEDRLILEAAKKSAAARKADIAGKSDPVIVMEYFEPVLAQVKSPGEAELKEFYDKNVALCGGASFDKVKEDLVGYLLQQKKEAAAAVYVRSLGQRTAITVSAAWLKIQIPLCRDNSVDKVRSGGKPAVVGFGGKSCCGPDKMAPVLGAISEKFKDGVSVVIIEAKGEPVLSGRYGIRSIPAQIFFDKAGREVFRHEGLMSEEDVVKQFQAMGVK
ncbi:MAG: thioredoxin domain-containing protein [Planctomycetota bacterium]